MLELLCIDRHSRNSFVEWAVSSEKDSESIQIVWILRLRIHSILHTKALLADYASSIDPAQHTSTS